MNIYVCVKHVPDSAATITIEGKTAINEKITFLVNPYDEHAITEATRLKAVQPGTEVVAVCLGKPSAENTLRSAMAMGADRGILITSAANLDSLATARALCAAIRQDGTPDIVFTGRESIDSEGFQTMFHLGAALGYPVVSNAVALTLTGGSVRVTCELEAGDTEHINMALPCVIGAGKDLNQPSYPKLPDILKARKKPLNVMDLADLTMDLPASRVEMIGLAPLKEERRPEVIDGTADEIADAIVQVLRDQAKVID